MATLPPPPLTTPFQDGNGLVSRPWQTWLQLLGASVSSGVGGGGGGGGFTAAGAGLTATGSTVNVNATDASISVSANSIAVGVISDANHGSRSGGSLHSLATATTSGFLAAQDWSVLDGLSLVAVRPGTGNDATALSTAEALRVSLGRDALLFCGTSYTFDAGGRSDDGFISEITLGIHVVGAPGNRINVINTTTGANDYGVDLFRTAQATLGVETPLTVFRGLNFWGDNGTDEATFTAQYQNQNSMIGTNNISTHNVLVENCTFQFGWGFSIHDRNDANSNVSTRGNSYLCMANGVNINASYSEHDGTGGFFYLTEGYECGGGATLIHHNQMRNVLGVGITIGGNQSGSWFEGSEVTANTIEICTGAGLTVTDGIRGAIISGNKVSRCDLGALIFAGAVTPPERCNVTGNIFYDNCKNPGANLVGIDIRDSSVGGHSITGNQCYDSGHAGYGQEFAMSIAVPNCKVFGNFFGGALIDVQYSTGATNTSESGNTYQHNTQQWISTASRAPDVITAYHATDYVWQTRLCNLSSLSDRAYFSIRADGYLEWGDNLNTLASLATNLYCSAAGVLKTDGTLTAANFKDTARARAAGSTATAGSYATGATPTIIDFGTTEFDTASGVTTGSSWKYTVPTGQGGVYELNAHATIGNIGGGTAKVTLYVYKNGSLAKTLDVKYLPSQNLQVSGSCKLALVPTDTVDFRLMHNAGFALQLSTTAADNHYSLIRLLSDL